MRQTLGAVIVLLSVAGPTFAANIAAPPSADTTGLVLIGGGLILAGCIARFGSKLRG